tara:strand:+ start:1338 stop:1538 length:201 start_codon:yes stop_codon:yes gene_type:complete
MRQIDIPLYLKEDKNGNEYMIGSMDDSSLAINVDLKKVTFIIFDPTEDNEGKIVAPGKLVIRPREY